MGDLYFLLQLPRLTPAVLPRVLLLVLLLLLLLLKPLILQATGSSPTTSATTTTTTGTPPVLRDATPLVHVTLLTRVYVHVV